MKNPLLAKSNKYRIMRRILPAILSFFAMGSLEASFSFASSHAPNFCDSYQGSVQGVLNFNAACHQLVDSLSQDKKMLLQDPTFVKRLQASFKNTPTTNAPRLPTPNSPAGRHILVQLLEHTGNAIPCQKSEPFPVWTLHGDGILIFSDQGYCGRLLQTQLTLTEVNTILDFIVNQNNFFASSQNFYGPPATDLGTIDLLVSTNGQDKAVTLSEFVGGDSPASLDAQTQHVFAIKDFLLSYHPANAQPYISTGGSP